MTPEVERRSFLADVSLRAAADGKGPGTLSGYAAVFGELSCDLGNFREQLAPGAFGPALERSDVRALFNHDDGAILGRLSAGTLRLVEDAKGLRYEVDLPDTTAGRDVAESVRRRDIQGCSFGFTTDSDSWDMGGPTPLRTVRRVKDLLDVGPVTFPAYEGTSVAVRSLTRARDAAAPPPSPPAAPAETDTAPETDADSAPLPVPSLAAARQRLVAAVVALF